MFISQQAKGSQEDIPTCWAKEQMTDEAMAASGITRPTQEAKEKQDNSFNFKPCDSKRMPIWFGQWCGENPFPSKVVSFRTVQCVGNQSFFLSVTTLIFCLFLFLLLFFSPLLRAASGKERALIIVTGDELFACRWLWQLSERFK